MDVMKLGVIFFVLIVMGFGLWQISKAKTDVITLRYGLLFIAIGLCCSLYSNLWLPLSNTADNAVRLQFLSNTFLIISSIGANLVAASVFLGSKKV